MSSKFFAEGNISEEQDNDKREQNETQSRNQPSYQYDFMDERFTNEKRVVRTEKDKKWNIIKDFTVKINNALYIQDFEKVWTVLQQLIKQVEKSSKIIEKQGYPPFFLRCLKKVNDEIIEFNKNAQARKKMKKHSAQAFNTMTQKMKKIYPEYQAKIVQLLERDGEGEEESEVESEESESEEEDNDEDDDITLLDSTDPMVRRRYWLKRIKKKEDSDEEKEKKEEEKKEDAKKEERKEGEKKEGAKKEVKVTQQKKKPTEIQSIKDAENRIKEIRKGFMKLHNQQDREQYLLTLDKISEKTKQAKDFQKLSFYLLDIPIRIDVCRQSKLTHFPRVQWLRLYRTITAIYHLLRESEEQDLVENIRLFDDVSNKSDAVVKVTEEGIYLSLKTYLILVESEIRKALVFLDSGELEYFERLQDLIGVVDLMYKISKELQIKDGYEKEAAELSFKVLENFYFMDVTLIERIKSELKSDVSFLELAQPDTVQQYANSVLRSRPAQQTRIKTLLYLIYNHTINGREKGKQLLTISTLPETILGQDYYTQALYNRVLVQIGVLAFRQGNIFQVQQFLYEMCSMAKMKETTRDVLKQFLAQGHVRQGNDKDIPKSKVLPVYLHLNVELIQSIELVASMLLEIPYTLTEGGRITSKTFKRFYYQYERNYFIGENLNNRDLIYAASLQLKRGNWKQCFDHLLGLNIWVLLGEEASVKQNLLRVVREQALKCYLIGNRKCFRSIGLAGLAVKFGLEEKVIRKHVCKLINEKIIQGSITREGYLLFVQRKQTEMQKICETLFDRVKEMSEANELWFNQKVTAGYDSDEEKEERTMNRRLNLAINEKLKAILSKRTQKY